MNEPIRTGRTDIVELAEKFKADPARRSQVTASILFSVAGAIAEGAEESLLALTAKFSEGAVRRLTASRN